jgi:myo-inositol-1(or 4)-monophosphatase
MAEFSVDDRRAVLRALEQIAREAGDVLLRGYRRPGAVAFKGPVDLVTDFDRRSEELIRARIAAELPGLALVAEEGGGELRRDRPTIYADPLDGTTNFAHGHPVFAVSLGLLEPDEGPTVGVVFAPVLGLLWSGAVGHGAHRNGEAMTVSDERELRRSLLATGFPYDRGEASAENDRQFAQFEAIERRGAQGVRRLGSAACDLCFVADGTYDGYWERKLSPWDLAAGAACVLAAGGTLSALDGGPADLCTGSVVASNGHIHRALLAALDERARATR